MACVFERAFTLFCSHVRTAMIIKNVKPTTTVETILKALDPYAYLDERNVRLVRGKPMGAKCFCFVDMDSHEVTACASQTDQAFFVTPTTCADITFSQ